VTVDTDDTRPAPVRVVNQPELVVGLIGALGTDLDEVSSALSDAFRLVDYTTEPLRVSHLISRIYSAAGQGPTHAETSMGDLMQQGDELRRAAGPDAAAVLAIGEMRRRRGGGPERETVAIVIRSLKRKEEVNRLRSVYGPRFVAVGAWSPKSEREKTVTRRLHDDHPGKDPGWYAARLAELMGRDEQDADDPLGQSVQQAFELADVYLAVRKGHSLAASATRVVRLLFGDGFLTPTRDEQAMFQAAGAGLRSSAAGRQVGAVVLDKDGEVVVTGTNDVPKAFGGQYWVGEEPDHRDFTYGYDVNDRQKLEITEDILERLRQAGWLTAAATPTGTTPGKAALDKGGPLRDSRIGDLLEFGRIVHAEMACICTAARRGTALRNLVMYTTTYPCHECARLIIASGLKELVYVDAYPKSQVSQMFADEVDDGPDARPDRVGFRPFEGVAPRLFRAVFSKTGRGRNRVTGAYDPWVPTEARPRLVVDADVRHAPKPLEDSAVTDLGSRLSAAGWSVPVG
jgi:deoxycytidylate deaminase